MALYDKVSVQGIDADNLEEVGKNLPLQSVQGNHFEETLIRLYKSNNLMPKKNYILALAEDEGRAIYDYVYS